MEPMENIRIVLAENMRLLRKQARISQDVLAERAGLSIGMIKNVELGNRWPLPATTEAIAKGLGVTISELFASKPKENIKTKAPPMSEFVNILLTIPDEIYELARDLKGDEKAWNDVRSMMRAHKLRIEKETKAPSRGA